jgi:hypothetical protein
VTIPEQACAEHGGRRHNSHAKRDTFDIEGADCRSLLRAFNVFG